MYTLVKASEQLKYLTGEYWTEDIIVLSSCGGGTGKASNEAELTFLFHGDKVNGRRIVDAPSAPIDRPL